VSAVRSAGGTAVLATAAHSQRGHRRVQRAMAHQGGLAMFLKHRSTGKMLEVLSLRDLFNPLHPTLVGRFHYGEEAQEPETFAKSDLTFSSGEVLPKCWTDSHYRDEEIHHYYQKGMPG
jgi:hypothetical protein